LEEALVAFGGNAIVVSHDRYFLNRVCTAILAFEGDGVIQYAVGNYDYYLEKRARPVAGVADPSAGGDTQTGIADVGRQESTPRTGCTDPGDRNDQPRKLKWKEERELEGMEAAILVAEEEVVRLEEIFAAPHFYTRHAADWQELASKLQEGRDRVARLYARWEELTVAADRSPVTEQRGGAKASASANDAANKKIAKPAATPLPTTLRHDPERSVRASTDSATAIPNSPISNLVSPRQ
jgi:hypothetical protein